jgi:hypothetical protein
MNRDDVIRWAREANIHVIENNTFADDMYISVLYRFATIVAAAELRRQHQEIERLRVREAADLLEIGCLVLQRDKLLETLKLVFPTLERLKFEADGSYGNNFSQARADTARKNYQAARAAIKKADMIRPKGKS